MDEETKDAVTEKKLPGSVHVHFDYVPIAHALTKEELEEDEEKVQVRQAELDDQAQMQNFKEFNLTPREKELDKRAKSQEQKEKEADERIAFEKERIESDKEDVPSHSLALDERESALDSKSDSIEADRIRNELFRSFLDR